MDLFGHHADQQLQQQAPLAERLRPRSLDEFIGQDAILGPGRLLRRAAEGNGASLLEEHFKGPTAVALSYGDPVGLAKVLVDYAEDHDDFEIKGAELDGKALGPSEVAHLATLPNLQELRGKLVGLLQAPATKLVRLLNEPGGQLARLMSARKDSIEE